MANLIQILNNGWILIGNQVAHNSAKTFLCGYVSCQLPQHLIQMLLTEECELEHPDNIEVMCYDRHPYTYHDGGMYNDALLALEPKMFSLYAL